MIVKFENIKVRKLKNDWMEDQVVLESKPDIFRQFREKHINLTFCPAIQIYFVL